MFSMDLKNVQVGKALPVTLSTFCLIISPFWFLFQFAHDIFISTELVKLLLLCLSIGFPVLIINLFTYLLVLVDDQVTNEEKENNIYKGLTVASLLTFPVYYIPCAISFFINLSQCSAIATGICVEVVILILIAITRIQDGKTF